MSLITRIADAVVTQLNGAEAGTFNQPFTAQRFYRPVYNLAELKDLRVSVVPRGITVTSLGRNSNQHEISVDIALQKKVAHEDLATMDRLMELVEQIGDFFRLRRLVACPEAIWSKTENVPVYAQEHLDQKQVFTSVLSVTFKVVR